MTDKYICINKENYYLRVFQISSHGPETVYEYMWTNRLTDATIFAQGNGPDKVKWKTPSQKPDDEIVAGLAVQVTKVDIVGVWTNEL